jgi:hypothetical protein
MLMGRLVVLHPNQIILLFIEILVPRVQVTEPNIVRPYE